MLSVLQNEALVHCSHAINRLTLYGGMGKVDTILTVHQRSHTPATHSNQATWSAIGVVERMQQSLFHRCTEASKKLYRVQSYRHFREPLYPKAA